MNSLTFLNTFESLLNFLTFLKKQFSKKKIKAITVKTVSSIIEKVLECDIKSCQKNIQNS